MKTAVLIASVVIFTNCNNSPRTAMRVAVNFSGALKLDQLGLSASNADSATSEKQKAPESPSALSSGVKIVVLVPDAWAGATVKVDILGYAASKNVAMGSVIGKPKLGDVVDLTVTQA